MAGGSEDEALAALCARCGLGEGQRERLAAILHTLASDPHAPTTVRDEARAIDVHLADSLTALDLEVVEVARRAADLGSGGGFPGLALATALRQCAFSLIESQRRKCAFIERLATAAQLDNVQVVCVRIEEWREGLEANDLVLARALGPQTLVLEYAAPLLRVGGAFVDWRGRRDPSGERAAAAAATELGLELREIRRVMPYANAQAHHLHLYTKIAPTPARFPRRAGVAAKRPLGIAPRVDRDRR